MRCILKFLTIYYTAESITDIQWVLSSTESVNNQQIWSHYNIVHIEIIICL